MFRVRHDPENGPVPRDFSPSNITRLDFHKYPDNRCRRCGRSLAVHIWQAVDTDNGPEDQDFIIDCGIKE